MIFNDKEFKHDKNIIMVCSNPLTLGRICDPAVPTAILTNYRTESERSVYVAPIELEQGCSDTHFYGDDNFEYIYKNYQCFVYKPERNK